ARRLVKDGGVDGVFLSCTNLKTYSFKSSLEQELGLPVLSSNSVLAESIRKTATITSANY
ncbi:MAG: Asp/Glu racemase, partial [Pseudomonadota bacterium]